MNTNPGNDGMQRATDLVDDADLFALFGKRAPDAQRFAAGVATRVHDRASGSSGVARPRAAGILPFDLGLLGASKLWWLATPALLLVGCVLAVLGSARWIGSSLRVAAPRPPAPGAIATTTFVVKIAPFLAMTLVCVAGIWFGGSVLADAVLLTVVASTAVLAFGLARCARVGGLDRAAVATLAVAILEALMLVSLQWSVPGPLTHDAEWNGALPWILGAGIACLLPFLTVRNRVLSAVVPGLVLLSTTVLPRRKLPAPDALAAVVATTAVDADRVDAWATLAHVATAARRAGADVALHPSVRTQVERAVAGETAAERFALTAAHQLGLVDEAAWRTVATRGLLPFLLQQLRRDKSPLRPQAFDAFLLPMLVATGGLDAATRDHLAERLVAGWPTTDTVFPLRDLVETVWWLDGLGRGDLVEARRDAIRTLLVAHQATGERPFRGGFAAHPQRLPQGDVHSTRDAVRLMQRVGVPSGLDLVELRRFLVYHGSELGEASSGVRLHRLAAFADLDALERLTGPIERPPLRTLVDERNLVAIASTVLLCVWAATRARRATAIAGAMP
jgi:hypothetical protein